VAARVPGAVTTPTTLWERPETAISSGLSPFSLTEQSARRRTGDAGLGRAVVVPIYVRGSRPGRLQTHPNGLLVTLSPGGELSVDRDLFPPHLGSPSAFWPQVHRAAREPEGMVNRDGWAQVALAGRWPDGGEPWGLVLRAGDWALVQAALAITHGDPTQPQDAAVERVVARFLGRLDGLDGTAASGLWGRLALEVAGLRHPGRLADTMSLRWYASVWQAGLSSSSAERDSGSAGAEMLLDLRYEQIRVLNGLFRVRTLPDWERQPAARDLGLPARQVLAWPVVPLPAVLACFTDIAPGPLGGPGGPGGPGDPQDAPAGPQDEPAGPQDNRPRPRAVWARRGPHDRR
jgi:hypothetical protein